MMQTSLLWIAAGRHATKEFAAASHDAADILTAATNLDRSRDVGDVIDPTATRFLHSNREAGDLLEAVATVSEEKPQKPPALPTSGNGVNAILHADGQDVHPKTSKPILKEDPRNARDAHSKISNPIMKELPVQDDKPEPKKTQPKNAKANTGKDAHGPPEAPIPAKETSASGKDAKATASLPGSATPAPGPGGQNSKNGKPDWFWRFITKTRGFFANALHNIKRITHD